MLIRDISEYFIEENDHELSHYKIMHLIEKFPNHTYTEP